MLVNPISFYGINKADKTKPAKNTNPIEKQDKLPKNVSSSRSQNQYAAYVAGVNKAEIAAKRNFEGSAAKKLFWVLTGRNSIYEDNYTKEHYYKNGNTGWRKWVDAPAYELLDRTPEQAIQSLCTIVKPDNSYPTIPDNIKTPNYGDNWGRKANYIELNPRTVGNHNYDRVHDGLLNTIKLLPAIPPSGNKFANCVVLSQLFPSIWGESYTGDGTSLYTMNLNAGISQNIASENLERDGVKVSNEEQVKAFNDLAHMRGLKTGFRMLLSEGQMWVGGEGFNWDNPKHQEAFINTCVNGINMGFDAIYFDSAKHIDGYDQEHYFGVGRLPHYDQMQKISYEIRNRTGRNDISIVGEKCDLNPRYEEMGYTAGTDRGVSDERSSVLHESRAQQNNMNYAAGPEVSNDNDDNYYTFDERLNRLTNCLFGHDSMDTKLPTFMQMTDIFPLTPYTSTHNEMLESRTKSSDGSAESHIHNVFDTSETARWFQHRVNQKFLDAIYL
ncbi:MAG: hypothetical protein PHV37_00855 [Candidatus Gastranaerophilales bacterium]|nr:hypothetical protein [Candidatus Gastranaerophilales bacterium]